MSYVLTCSLRRNIVNGSLLRTGNGDGGASSCASTIADGPWHRSNVFELTAAYAQQKLLIATTQLAYIATCSIRFLADADKEHMATAEQVEMVMEGLSMLDVHLQVPCPSPPIISPFRP